MYRAAGVLSRQLGAPRHYNLVVADEEFDSAQKEHELYLEERKQLIDAARESSRTFDKAVLTFGAAIFGASIAFLKDIAPRPAADTLKWLGAAWLLFSIGLLIILLSFLFSHQACLFEIECATKEVVIRGQPPKNNPWSTATTWCNFLSVVLLFFGLLCWSSFAFANLNHGGIASMDKVDKVETPTEIKGYVPPSPPAKAPQERPAPPSQPPPKK